MTKTTTKDTKTYGQLRAELDGLLTWFDQEDLDVDQALDKYQQAIKLTKELETYLQQAENTVKKLTT